MKNTDSLQERSHNTPLPGQLPADSAKMLSILPLALYTCNAEGVITFYNQAAAELWGREPEIGKDLWCGSWKIFHPGSGKPMAADQCPMAITLKERRAVKDEEILIERPDGIRLNILPNPTPLFDEQGNLTGAINTLVDLTEKKKKDQTNQEHLRYYKMVEEVEDYAILLLDKAGNVQNWNLGAEKIKGYTEKEIVGKNFSIFYTEQDRLIKLPQQLIERAAREGRAIHEGWRVRKDGTRFWGNIVITALHDAHQDIIGFSKVTRDLTERKLAEDQLKSYAADIEFRNKQLEEYAYIASHDLQEPLRKIRTFANLLKENKNDASMVDTCLEKIEASAKRMTVLITDVLEYSQLSQADELFVPVSLNEIVENVKGDLDLLIEQRNAVVKSGKLPTVKAIPIQIHQLFSNLITNAIKFSNENPLIEISARIVKNSGQTESASRQNVEITLKDNGSGFDQQYADQIFKMFKRAHHTAVGTGIGLALCKRIVENHGGEISVQSEINKGTVFTILLPFSDIEI